MDTTEDFGALQERISSALVSATRTATQLSAEDLPFQRSLDPAFGRSLDRQSKRLLNLATTLIQNVAAGSELDAPRVQDVEDVENGWRGIVDVVDSLLEQADTCLDEYTGVIKRPNVAQQDQSEATPPPKPNKAKLSASLRNQKIPKPQLLFKSTTTNNEVTPFRPLLRSKPHASVSLEESLKTIVNEEGTEIYAHPYEFEIINLQYPRSVYEQANPQPFSPLDASAATFVDTPQGVRAMLAELKLAREIAIDLEHHDTRSYVGLVSLMQISTRDKDWIVDTLKPWREDLQVLNEVFADPSILKVFHGAFMDMVWLQRDLGLYVVGLFDTYHAARALGYPQASLASLLSRFIHFDADKQYQMADWRIRPLPKELFDYARSDTHFLLHIYDHMRNELLERSESVPANENPLERVLQNSKGTSLQLYERYIYDETTGKGAGGWFNMLKRTPALFSNEQFSVFQAVHHWRDTIARQNDDSLNYIMPKHVLFSIARAMPTDMAALLGVSHPISQPVRARASELLSVIQKAKETGSAGPNMIDVLRPDPAPLPGMAVRTEVTEDQAGINSSAGLHPGSSNNVSQAHELPLISAGVSHFWGPAFGSSVWQDGQTDKEHHEAIRLAVPLPQLTAEVFVTNGALHPDDMQGSDPKIVAEHEYVKDRKRKGAGDDGVFIIKQLGGGRKRVASELDESMASASVPNGRHSEKVDAGEPIEQDIMVINTDEMAQARKLKKAERKAQKKGQKRLEKEQKRKEPMAAGDPMGPNTAAEGEPPEAFDYANAESVLHAKRDSLDRKGGKVTFNPYAKSGDAPKGMGRARKEKPGKSLTFRQ